jgi:hypothetical protein
MRRRAAMLACAAVLAAPAAVLAAPTAAQARGLTAGFYDPEFTGTTAATRGAWFESAATVGARTVRIEANWAQIAPATRPEGFDPANHESPGYRWEVLDAALREAGDRKLRPLLTILYAPEWAEAPGRPASTRSGTWRPQPAALAAFARALARRYSGRFTDPHRPYASLPRVPYFQIWNEPNLTTYLGPQWRRSGKRTVPASPSHYRSMLNAAYDAIKKVDRKALVVAAGTSPYGDPGTGGRRMPPARFVRELLCFKDRQLRKASCPKPARLDVLSHHPYSVGKPGRHARNPDDVSIPDLARLTRPLRAAERSGRVLPRKRKRLWITEVSWDSAPPDPDGVPEATHARWLAEALRLLWRQGVDSVYWFLVRDQDPSQGAGYPGTYQSGVLFRDGSPKAAARAFRFPFVALGRGRGRIAVWVEAPVKGTVSIQRRKGSGWVTVAKRSARAGRPFETTLRLRGSHVLRAVAGTETSIERSARG